MANKLKLDTPESLPHNLSPHIWYAAFHSMTEAANILQLDPETGQVTIQYVNPAWEELNQVRANEVIGLPLSQIELLKAIDPIWLSQQIEAMRAGHVMNGEITIPLAEGMKTLRWRGSPLFSEDNAITHFVVIAHDMTPLLKAEQEEREQRIFADSLRNAGSILTSSLDFDTICQRILEIVVKVFPADAANLMFVEGNSARAHYTKGYEPEKADSLLTIALPLNLPGFRQIMQSQKCLLIPDVREIDGWSNTSSVRSYLGAPLVMRGEIIGFLNIDSFEPNHFLPIHMQRLELFADQMTIAIDNAKLYEEIHHHVTQLEHHVSTRTRELMIANEKLKEMDRIKSKFIDDMSHELRTPLSTMSSQVYLIEQDIQNSNVYFHALRQELESLTDLLNNVLRFKSTLDLQSTGPSSGTNINDVIASLVKEHQPFADRINLKVSTELDSMLPNVTLSLEHCGEIIKQLLWNALIYTSYGGITIKTYQPDSVELLAVEVADTGMGINPDDLPHIFDQFYRGINVGSSTIPGSGLGLTIVKKLVDLYGGQISVQSEANQGSKFTVLIPTERGKVSLDHTQSFGLG